MEYFCFRNNSGCIRKGKYYVLKKELFNIM